MPQRDMEVMTYDAMALGRRFKPVEFEVDDALLVSYARITGGPVSPAPVGLLAIFGRRAYLTEGVMPSGGVMATLEVTYLSPLPLDTPLVATAEVVQRQERKDRGWVTISIRFTSGPEQFADARIVGVWPL